MKFNELISKVIGNLRKFISKNRGLFIAATMITIVVITVWMVVRLLKCIARLCKQSYKIITRKKVNQGVYR